MKMDFTRPNGSLLLRPLPALLSGLLIVWLIVGCTPTYAAQTTSPIKLVLQITIDGLRADLIKRYQKHFGPHGFNYLLNNGVVYTSAHYLHANTETIVGHATLATGAHPAQHGLIGNVWFDSDTRELAYNIEDPKYPLLPVREGSDTGAQVDPAQKAARTQGRSPRAMLVATFSDVLQAFHAGKAKIFGVSGKDRSAVSMAGQVGKAFWFSTNSGDFITSKFYYRDYPEWVAQWNQLRKALRYEGKAWELAKAPGEYLLAEQDDRPYERDLKGYGRVFPHPFGTAKDPLYFTRLLVSPVVDLLTLDFSKQLLINEKLGQDEVPDYLSISLSGVDAVNHFFGPSSLENEEVIVRLDRTLADLLGFIEQRVGLKHTLIVLSADHGMADMPEYMASLGYHTGRISDQALLKMINQMGQKKYQIDKIARLVYRPYVYLDRQKIAAAKLDQVQVEQSIAHNLNAVEGIALAVPRSGLGPLQKSPLLDQIQRNFHPSRSGDIYVVQMPYWFMFSEGAVVAMHGSPYSYDTHVPIIFAGPGVRPRRVHRMVHPVDVAPTLCAVLGLTPPSSASGLPLVEVLE